MHILNTLHAIYIFYKKINRHAPQNKQLSISVRRSRVVPGKGYKKHANYCQYRSVSLSVSGRYVHLGAPNRETVDFII